MNYWWGVGWVSGNLSEQSIMSQRLKLILVADTWNLGWVKNCRQCFDCMRGLEVLLQCYYSEDTTLHIHNTHVSLLHFEWGDLFLI